MSPEIADGPPSLDGLHHVRLPVVDVGAVRQWFEDVLGFVCVLDYEEEDGVSGCVLAHRSGFSVGVHQAPAAASAVDGFEILTLSVGDQAALTDWIGWLDRCGTDHGPVCEAHIGLFVNVAGPGGIAVRLHTSEHPAADAG